MRKLDRISLGEIDLTQCDILQKKDMQNIVGGITCWYRCGMGVEGEGEFECESLYACHDKIADICEYGWYGSCY